MGTEQLRAFLLEYLKVVVNQKDQLQYSYCLSNVRSIAKERCPGLYQEEEDGVRLKHVNWDLILARVLTPGTNSTTSTYDGWPFLSVTDHGRKVIAEQRPVPYDPDGYIARLNQRKTASTQQLKHISQKQLRRCERETIWPLL